MNTLRLALFASLMLVACTPPYGRQSCKTNVDCTGDGQECGSSCELPDAGPGKTVSHLCSLPCTQDADCNNLGLKKPKCVQDACLGGGRSACVDFPF